MSDIESVLSEANIRMTHKKLYGVCTDHQILLGMLLLTREYR